MEKDGLSEMLLKDIEKSRFDFDTKKVGNLEVETAALFQNYIKNFYSQQDDAFLSDIQRGWIDYRAAYKGNSFENLQKENGYLHLTVVSRWAGITGLLIGFLINPAFLIIGCAGIASSFYFSSKAAEKEKKKTDKKFPDVLDMLDLDMLKAVLLEKKEVFYPQLFSKTYKPVPSPQNP